MKSLFTNNFDTKAMIPLEKYFISNLMRKEKQLLSKCINEFFKSVFVTSTNIHLILDQVNVIYVKMEQFIIET